MDKRGKEFDGPILKQVRGNWVTHVHNQHDIKSTNDQQCVQCCLCQFSTVTLSSVVTSRVL